MRADSRDLFFFHAAVAVQYLVSRHKSVLFYGGSREITTKTRTPPKKRFSLLASEIALWSAQIGGTLLFLVSAPCGFVVRWMMKPKAARIYIVDFKEDLAKLHTLVDLTSTATEQIPKFVSDYATLL